MSDQESRRGVTELTMPTGFCSLNHEKHEIHEREDGLGADTECGPTGRGPAFVSDCLSTSITTGSYSTSGLSAKLLLSCVSWLSWLIPLHFRNLQSQRTQLRPPRTGSGRVAPLPRHVAQVTLVWSVRLLVV